MFCTEPYFLGVVSSNQPSYKTGGTHHFMSNKNKDGKEVILNPDLLISNQNSPEIVNKIAPIELQNTGKSIPSGMVREVRSILFADVVGFSKIPEYQKPYFLKEFMDLLSANISALEFKPEVLNSWGDAIFFVGENTHQATQFAFMLRNMVLNTNWEEKNLPFNLNIRIALHAGPVFIGEDPVLKRKNAYGAHVNRAARMEPITIPGQIYASDQFTANLMVETENKYNYEYVGNLELPKAFGNQDLYSIRERVN
jgi:class 3 adenylate cyclase